MKHVKTATSIALSLLLLITFSACTKKDQVDPGSVYLRIISSPDLEEYSDNNDCIPYDFIEGEEYGVCEPGSFTYSFKTEPNASGTYWYINSGTYTITKEPGKRRVYTLSLGPNISLTYDDN